MTTRAVPVVVERSPGGGGGISLRVGAREKFTFGNEFVALGWVAGRRRERGADQAERKRVLVLLAKELGRKLRAEVTAEVAS